MSIVGYPPIMSKKSYSKYPQAMPERTYDARHPQKSRFIKDQHEKSYKSDGCVHSQKYVVAKDRHNRVTCDEHRKNQTCTAIKDKHLCRNPTGAF